MTLGTPVTVIPLRAAAKERRRRTPRHRAARVGGTMITRGADYAVRALVYLATQPEAVCVHGDAVAAAIGAPAVFTGKVLQQLAAASLVATRHGRGGGVWLLPAGRRASMLDVIVAVDGRPALNRCLSPDTPCERATFCPAHLVWREAQARAMDVLAAATIERLATGTVEESCRPK